MDRKLILVVLAVLLCAVTTAFALDEKITLSTYYPAPYGEYDSLVANNLQVDGTIETNTGFSVNGTSGLTQNVKFDIPSGETVTIHEVGGIITGIDIA